MYWDPETTMSTQDTSNLRITGDSRPSTVNHFLSVSSGDRNKSTSSTPNDCEITFDELHNVLSLELMNFEIPHTRFAVTAANNTLYISERMGDAEFNFFALKVATSGYLVNNLAVALELSQKCPTKYSADAVLQNTYNFVSAGSTGKVAIISSGDVEYNIHNAQEALAVVEFTKNSTTEASVKFLAPFDFIVAPGAMLMLKLYNNSEIEIQVIYNEASRVVTVIGDFESLDESTIDLSNAIMTPYSATGCVSEVIGFGVVDFQPLIGVDSLRVLGIESAFSSAIDADDAVVTPMVCTEFPAFVSSGDYIQLSNTYGFLQDAPSRVSTTHDDSHFELEYDPALAFAGSGVSALSSNGDAWPVDTIEVKEAGDNEASIAITLGEDSWGLAVNDEVTLVGLTGDHWTSSPVVTLTSLETASAVTGTVRVPSLALVDEANGSTRATPVNPTTGFSTTYVSPFRFDLSRGRRIILCRATIDDLDVGNIRIPQDRTKFFGRIQLFSGADLVNFLSRENARGEHTFNSLVKRMRSIRLRFYNEDGSDYDFVGVEFTLFIKAVCLDSNTGI